MKRLMFALMVACVVYHLPFDWRSQAAFEIGWRGVLRIRIGIGSLTAPRAAASARRFRTIVVVFLRAFLSDVSYYEE